MVSPQRQCRSPELLLPSPWVGWLWSPDFQPSDRPPRSRQHKTGGSTSAHPLVNPQIILKRSPSSAAATYRRWCAASAEKAWRSAIGSSGSPMSWAPAPSDGGRRRYFGVSSIGYGTRGLLGTLRAFGALVGPASPRLGVARRLVPRRFAMRPPTNWVPDTCDGSFSLSR